MAVFYVLADGMQLAYPWRKDGVELSDTERIFGSQTLMLAILNVEPGMAFRPSRGAA